MSGTGRESGGVRTAVVVGTHGLAGLRSTPGSGLEIVRTEYEDTGGVGGGSRVDVLPECVVGPLIPDRGSNRPGEQGTIRVRCSVVWSPGHPVDRPPLVPSP